MTAVALAVMLVAGWPELDLRPPNLLMKRNDINGKGLTCTGIMMSEGIHRNQRGDNPDVPVGMISRFPMLDPVERYISNFHVYCAIVLMIVIYVNFAGPKGNDPDPAKGAFHVWFGRVFSWLMAPHYAIVGLVLNYYAIMSPSMEDWLLGTDVTGWRAQLAYITPFGINVLVCTFMGFFLCKTLPAKPWASILKSLSMLSIVFWMTIGVYVLGAQIVGGMGAFGLPIEKVLDGAGKHTTENQDWFRTIAFLTFAAGFLQAFFDYVNYKILCLVEASGTSVIAWKDMHKWAMLNLAFQAGFIFGFFVAIFPYCSFGLPEWTCLPLGAAAPIAVACCWPCIVHFAWMKAFVKALLSGKIADFSKSAHKWDGPYTPKVAKTA